MFVLNLPPKRFSQNLFFKINVVFLSLDIWKGNLCVCNWLHFPFVCQVCIPKKKLFSCNWNLNNFEA